MLKFNYAMKRRRCLAGALTLKPLRLKGFYVRQSLNCKNFARGERKKRN